MKWYIFYCSDIKYYNDKQLLMHSRIIAVEIITISSDKENGYSVKINKTGVKNNFARRRNPSCEDYDHYLLGITKPNL